MKVSKEGEAEGPLGVVLEASTASEADRHLSEEELAAGCPPKGSEKKPGQQIVSL